jgi:ribonucleoside-diphosphate reductase beta chain
LRYPGGGWIPLGAMTNEPFWESTLGGHFVLPKRSFWPNFFSKVVARSQWDPEAIDLTPDARTWQELPAERRRHLMTLLAGFRVGEDAVSEHIKPFADAAREATLASQESLMAWVFFLQRRDEDRHARFFDRVAAEVLALPGDTPAERREAAKAHAPAGVVELFEEQLPETATELEAGRTGLAEGVSLYHMLLEGVVFLAGQHALLEDLADGALPGVRYGLERVQLDERWHVGFGLRCLIECEPSRELLDELLVRSAHATGAWGDVLPASTREFIADLSHHRLAAVGLVEPHAAAERAVRRAPAA